MSACKSRRKTEDRPAYRSLFRTRETMMVSLAVFFISALYMSYQVAKAVAALNVWADLKATNAGSDRVEKALQSLNGEETMLIAPLGLT